MTWIVNPEATIKETLRGKHVALVAPGSTLELFPQASRHVKIDDAELVIRCNGPWPLKRMHRIHYGRRTDILYVGGRRFFLRRGNQLQKWTRNLPMLCIYPVRRRTIMRKLKGIDGPCPMRFTSRKINRKWRELLRRSNISYTTQAPTTGMVAIIECLLFGAAEIALHGFTFYRQFDDYPYYYATGYHRMHAWRRGANYSAARRAASPHALDDEWVIARKLIADGKLIPDEPLKIILEHLG